MQVKNILLAGVASAAAVICCASAQAEVVTFNQFNGPSLFSSATAAPLTVTTSIGPVTFAGGAVLTNTSNLPADQTSLYGTASFLTGGLNPLTITFTQPINNFFLNLYNGQTTTTTYTISDNAGHSTTVNLAPNSSSGTSLVSFPATGNIVSIMSTTSAMSFDFFIDNVGFNEATPGVPEPGIWATMMLGMGAMGAALRRRRAIRTAASFA